VPLEEPTWQMLVELSQYFHERVARDGGMAPSTCRIVFPTMLEGYSRSAADVSADHFDGSIRLLGGHALVQAWYVAALQAGQAENHEWLRQLWQAALTVTLKVSIIADPAALMVESMQLSERIKTSERTLTDTFPCFCQKLGYFFDYSKHQFNMGNSSLTAASSAGIRFNGVPISRSMMQAAVTLSGVWSPDAQAMIARIDAEYGRDLLSMSYSKLLHLAMAAKSMSQHCSGCKPEELFEQLLQMVYISVSRNLAPVKFFTVEALAKQRDGSSGWATTTAAKQLVVMHIAGIAADLTKVDAASGHHLLDQALPVFATPMSFHHAFPCNVAGGEDQEALAPESSLGAADSTVALEQLKEGKSKGVQRMIDLLYNLYEGSYDRQMKYAASQTSPIQVIQESEDAGVAEFAKELRECIRLLSSAASVVAVEPGAAPPPSLRALARMRSDTDAAEERAHMERAERAEVWQKAQAQRRKLIQLGKRAGWKVDAYADCYRKATAVRNFKGVLKQQHRAFVVSADLLACSSDEPWTGKVAPAKKDHLQAMLEFALQQTGPTDFIFMFDGRCRSNRRVIEDAIATKPHTVEAWVIYEAGKERGKAYAMGGNRREAFYVVLPAPRNRLETKQRATDQFSKCGKSTTHHTTYSGVPLRQLKDMPKISRQDKVKAFPELADTQLAPGNAAPETGVPLYWSEAKPLELFSQLINDFDIACVFDCTPGSGAFAQAALMEGIPYYGSVTSDTHLSWLSNELDQRSLVHMVTSGAPLFQEDLAASIKAHFSELLDTLNAEDDEEEEDEQGGEE